MHAQFLNDFLEESYVPADNGFHWLPISSREEHFAYSDGDEIEIRLLNILRQATDVHTLSPELSKHITDWPSCYHLSPRRANLLRPLSEYLKDKRVLEIGAGCGAITRFMGEHDATVIAIEGSQRRATIAAERCRDLPNVRVIAEPFDQLAQAPQFDVVTLIGVLEYARVYYPSENGLDPIHSLLQHARRFLKPNGILLLAIENQIGLKYYAGHCEDHIGRPMYGIEDLYRSDGPVTFGRKELGETLKSTGFDIQQWLFPFPDYKLPTSILTSFAVDDPKYDLSPLLGASVISDPQLPPQLTFSLEQAWKPIFRNGLSGSLANSFLVIAGSTQPLQPIPENVLCFHYSVDRKPIFAKETRLFLQNDELLTSTTSLKIQKTYSSDQHRVSHFTGEGKYITGQHWLQKLYQILNTPNWSTGDIIPWAKIWFTALADKANIPQQEIEQRTEINPHFYDAIPRNFILKNADGGDFFDLEWMDDKPLTLGFMLFRGMTSSLQSIHTVALPQCNQPLSIIEITKSIFSALGFSPSIEDFEAYALREVQFQNAVTGIQVHSSAILNSILKARIDPTISIKTPHPPNKIPPVQYENAEALQINKDNFSQKNAPKTIVTDRDIYERSQDKMAHGKTEEAFQILIEMAQRGTTLWEPYYLLALYAQDQGDLSAAEDLLIAAMQNERTSYLATRTYGKLLIDSGRYRDALSTYGRLLQSTTIDVEILKEMRHVVEQCLKSSTD